MKTRKIFAMLSILTLLMIWGCQKDVEMTAYSNDALKYEAKRGGKPGSDAGGITIKDLGTPGGTWSRANSIALVEGEVYIAGEAETSSGDRHAFLWTDANGWQDLGYLHEEYPYSEANDINGSGTITGWTSSIVPPFYSNNAVTWSASNPSTGPTSINPPSSVNSSAEAINIHGDMVGSRVDTCGYAGYGDCGSGSPGSTISIWSAFMWKADGSNVDIGTLGGDSWATGINNSSVVTGYSEIQKGEHDIRAFIWQQGTFEVLPGLEDLWSWANDINDAGQIVGYYDTLNSTFSSSSAIRGFLWQNGVLTKLPTLGTRTMAYAVSESGYITGTTWAQTNGSKGRTNLDVVPFLYRQDIGIINLGSFNKGGRGDGFDIVEKTANIIIIVGSGNVKGNRHALMWTIDLCTLIPGRC